MVDNTRVSPIDVHIAGRIQELRIKADVRLNSVANHLGVRYQSYQKMEAGKTAFRARTLELLSSLYGVPVSYFFEGAPPPDINNAEELAIIGQVIRRVPKHIAGEIARAVMAQGSAYGIK